jgi:hypothetical protein
LNDGAEVVVQETTIVAALIGHGTEGQIHLSAIVDKVNASAVCLRLNFPLRSGIEIETGAEMMLRSPLHHPLEDILPLRIWTLMMVPHSTAMTVTIALTKSVMEMERALTTVWTIQTDRHLCDVEDHFLTGFPWAALRTIARRPRIITLPRLH